MRRAVLALLLAALLVPAGAQARVLAGGCFRVSGQGPFALKATALGDRYLLLDSQGRLLRRRGGRTVHAGGPETAGPDAVWTVHDGRKVRAARGCARFPEADAGVSGRPGPSVRRDGSIAGWADTHLHITANLRAGGRVIHGEPFDRFGIARALGADARDHGEDGSLDVTGDLLRSGVPFGTHDTQGWPSFAGWPVHGTYTHQQVYWTWLQRAWRSGLRLVVAQTVEDDELCRIEVRRSHSCDEPATIALEVRQLRALQDYVDAQAGGRGRGFFRIVEDPAAARRVMAAGKLAVVIGVESSNPFGCDLRPGRRHCRRADVDRGLERYRRLGVRSLFIAHWFDNAFGGAALEGATKGKFINAMNRLETGHWFADAACPGAGQGEEVVAITRGELQVVSGFFPATKPLLDAPPPAYPAGRRCNARGLTPLGEYLVRRLMARHMLIEVDHLSERARDRVLAITGAAHYPVVSGHNGTGGAWTPAELRRLRAAGGIASATPGTAPELAAKIRRLAPYDRGGVPLGSDVGGFSDLPEARKGAPLRYPFRSYDGRLTFRRQRTGRRTFDLGRDGVAHYGLFADLVADLQRSARGRAELRPFFRSAQAYLAVWERASRSTTPRG